MHTGDYLACIHLNYVQDLLGPADAETVAAEGTAAFGEDAHLAWGVPGEDTLVLEQYSQGARLFSSSTEAQEWMDQVRESVEQCEKFTVGNPGPLFDLEWDVDEDLLEGNQDDDWLLIGTTTTSADTGDQQRSGVALLQQDEIVSVVSLPAFSESDPETSASVLDAVAERVSDVATRGIESTSDEGGDPAGDGENPGTSFVEVQLGEELDLPEDSVAIHRETNDGSVEENAYVFTPEVIFERVTLEEGILTLEWDYEVQTRHQVENSGRIVVLWDYVLSAYSDGELLGTDEYSADQGLAGTPGDSVYSTFPVSGDLSEVEFVLELEVRSSGRDYQGSTWEFEGEPEVSFEDSLIVDF